MMRQTKQKGILEKELRLQKGFFSAEQLHEAALRHDLTLGIATVYRFLKDKITHRKLHSYTCDRKQIYSTAESTHCHYTCQVCGSVKHIEIKDLSSLKKNIHGSICHFQIDVHGVCEECERKRK